MNKTLRPGRCSPASAIWRPFMPGSPDIGDRQVDALRRAQQLKAR
jgi:hypothetical protein